MHYYSYFNETAKLLGGYREALYVLLKRNLKSPFVVTPHECRHPLWIRPRSSDIAVFQQVFIERQYQIVQTLESPSLIIDAGANVGFSSIFFLNMFPCTNIIAVEPDFSNFTQLKLNLLPYHDHIELINAGLWSHSTSLFFNDNIYRDGLDWTRQFLETPDSNASSVPGVSIDTLLMKYPSQRISLLKVDIEGAEAIVFSKGYESWLHLVDAIIIELHDDSCFGEASTIFYDAIRNHNFSTSESGELMFCIRHQ